MPYRFIRKISNSVAEVSTPNGRTIRLPYTGKIPDKGSVVDPIIGGCCCPKGLAFPTAAPRHIHTTPSPRRSYAQGIRSEEITSVIVRGNSIGVNGFAYNPDLPETYTFIYQPGFSDYPASKFPLVGMGVVMSNLPGGPEVRGLTTVRFGKVAYQFEDDSFGTTYDDWGNTTYYGGNGGVRYGALLLKYRYNIITGKVSDTGVTIQEYVDNHMKKYPLSDTFYFAKYYIGDNTHPDLDNIVGTPNYSAKFIVNSIQPKTKYFLAHTTGVGSFVLGHRYIEYVGVN